MPASVVSADKRTPTPLTVLFWIGVGLAPLAALILLVADGTGTLRFGAVLAILAVVLIGLSVALRADHGGVGAEELREEMEQLRRELRAEIVAAAQRGNQALDQARRAEEAAGAVRHRLDAAAAGLAAAPAEERPGGRARVPVAGAYEAGRSHPAGRDEEETAGRYGPDQRAESARARHDVERPGSDGYPVEGRARPEPSGVGRDRPAGGHDEERTGFGGRGAEPARPGPRRAEFDGYGAEPVRPAGRASAGAYGAARVSEPASRPESRPVGVVHHTETVHVTTRHTIVGGGGDPSGSRYGGFSGRWSPSAEDRPRGADPEEYRAADRGDGSRSGADPEAWPGSLRAGAERQWPGAPDDDPQSGYRSGGSGDGWAGDDSARPGDGSGWAGNDSGRAAGGSGWAGGGSGWPGDGPGRAGGEHPWASVGRSAAGGRGWSPRTPDDGRPAGDDRARPVEEPAWPPAGQYGRATTSDRFGRADPVERSGPVTPAEPDGENWSELRAGNRWAAVRDDGQGREFRVGERRAAVHADGGGTEYRIEDRWAAVRNAPGEYGGSSRHDPEPSYGGGSPHHDPGGSGAAWPDPEPPYGDSAWAGESRPALPAGGVPVPGEWRPPTQRSGQPEWRQAEPEWRQPEPEWRQPEPQWHRPEPGGHGQPPRDVPDRWR
ncbi:hypothetical protein [Micromonospora sp. WMMD980]|uniref:hypothetical protein n=1 Tax=Micromonospora sp. WMMD980 TaxID=3016088 RepID=UPI00241664F6|nr:hypothetical protein [Micromonospora sp. WMMD980]MDG4804299.1 hypothetical protein [Micromonospora sp. WMMD980]